MKDFNQVFVSDTYEVQADVSVAAGDIDYDGNVEVKSELMSIIENSGQINTQRDDWMSTMV